MTQQLAQLAKILGPAPPFPEPALSGDDAGGADVDLGKPAASSKKNSDGKALDAARQTASTAHTRKTATPTAATEATTPPTPAPTSTITRSGDNEDGIQRCPPGHTIPSPEENSAPPEKDAAAAAGARKERQPAYRVEEVPRPPVNGGSGGGRKGKRAFVVTIDLPDLIDGGDAEGKRREPAGSQEAGGAEGGDESTKRSADSSKGDDRGRQGKVSSLSDFELDVLPRVLELKVPGKYHLRLDMPCIVEDENVTAKFNKSRAVLKVSVHEK